MMMMKNSSSSSSRSMMKSWLTEPEFDAACQLIQLLSGDSHSAGAAAESEEEDTGSINKAKYKISTTSDHRVMHKNELAEENVSDLHDHHDEISISSSSSSSESAIRVAEDLDVCEVYSSRKRKFRSILDLYAITKPLLFKKAAT